MTHPSLRLTIRLGLITGLLAACSPASVATPTPTFSPIVTSTFTPTIVPTLTEQPSQTPTPVITVCSPLIHHPLSELPDFISQAFTMPSSGKDDGHPGLDLGHWYLNGEASILNDPVQPVLTGSVAAASKSRPPLGALILIEVLYPNLPPALINRVPIPAGKSLYMLYAHLVDAPPLRIGKSVSCGEEIGRVGLTGWTGAPHLHFETRWGPPGMTFSGMAYYTADATATESKNYETFRMSGQFHPFDPMLLLTIQP